jgi:hypothetical protein
MHGRRSLGILYEQMPPRCVCDRYQIGGRAIRSLARTVAYSDGTVTRVVTNGKAAGTQRGFDSRRAHRRIAALRVAEPFGARVCGNVA